MQCHLDRANHVSPAELDCIAVQDHGRSARLGDFLELIEGVILTSIEKSLDEKKELLSASAT